MSPRDNKTGELSLLSFTAEHHIAPLHPPLPSPKFYTFYVCADEQKQCADSVMSPGVNAKFKNITKGSASSNPKIRCRKEYTS